MNGKWGTKRSLLHSDGANRGRVQDPQLIREMLVPRKIDCIARHCP
jgi:hypothetical protein